MYFSYGKKELEYLAKKDKKLGEAIAGLERPKREVEEDLFLCVVHQIAGQQISSAALATVWERLKTGLGEVTADTVTACGADGLQSFGMSHRKAEYIMNFAKKVKSKEWNLEEWREWPDEKIIETLTELKGIGVWTAEMVLIFGLQRPDVFSFGDYGIRKGLQVLHHHKEIDKKRFETYRRRYHPYGTVASLYLWEIAGNEQNKK